MQQANPGARTAVALAQAPPALRVALDAARPVPLYMQLRDSLRDLIDRGVLRDGERLAPTRDMARDLGVNRTTVSAAYAELEAEGLLRGHVGRGTFVIGPAQVSTTESNAEPSIPADAAWEHPGQPGVETDELESILAAAATPGAISFAAAHPPTGLLPLEDFRKACNVVLRREGEAIFRAGPVDGYGPLREWLAAWLERQGVPASPDEIIVTNGCQQSLDLLAKAFIEPGQAVVMENPTYPGALLPFRQAGARILPVPVGPAGADPRALSAILDRYPVRLIVLTPNFQNPTGTTLPPESRRRIMEAAIRRQVPVVENDIHGLLRYQGPAAVSLRAIHREGAIHIASFSKLGFPGLRLGWCVAPPALGGRLRRAKQGTDLHTDQFVQAVMLEFGKRGGLRRAVNAVRDACAGNQAALVAAAARHLPSSVRWQAPQGGMAAWMELPPVLDAAAVLARTRQRGVLFTPGRFFYFAQPRSNVLRLSFGRLHPAAIEKGMEVLGNAIRAELRAPRPAARGAATGRMALV